MIKNMGINGGHIRGDLPFAMIATEAIAEVAAQHLLELNFSGKSVWELLAPRGISMEEVTRIIGEKTGKPDLPYVHFSQEEYINGLPQTGLAKDMAEQLTELDAGINDRLFASAEHRDLFQSNPENYAPRYGGYCAWAVSQGYTASVDPKNAWKIVDGKLYLNYNVDIQKKWAKDIPDNIQKADANWPSVLN